MHTLKNKKVKYWGVSFVSDRASLDHKTNKYRAQIRHNGTMKHLGVFANQKDAALAFDKEQRRKQMVRDCLNFPTFSDVANIIAIRLRVAGYMIRRKPLDGGRVTLDTCKVYREFKNKCDSIISEYEGEDRISTTLYKNLKSDIEFSFQDFAEAL